MKLRIAWIISLLVYLQSVTGRSIENDDSGVFNLEGGPMDLTIVNEDKEHPKLREITYFTIKEKPYPGIEGELDDETLEELIQEYGISKLHVNDDDDEIDRLYQQLKKEEQEEETEANATEAKTLESGEKPWAESLINTNELKRSPEAYMDEIENIPEANPLMFYEVGKEIGKPKPEEFLYEQPYHKGYPKETRVDAENMNITAENMMKQEIKDRMDTKINQIKEEIRHKNYMLHQEIPNVTMLNKEDPIETRVDAQNINITEANMMKQDIENSIATKTEENNQVEEEIRHINNILHQEIAHTTSYPIYRTPKTMLDNFKPIEDLSMKNLESVRINPEPVRINTEQAIITAEPVRIKPDPVKIHPVTVLDNEKVVENVFLVYPVVSEEVKKMYGKEFSSENMRTMRKKRDVYDEAPLPSPPVLTPEELGLDPNSPDAEYLRNAVSFSLPDYAPQDKYEQYNQPLLRAEEIHDEQVGPKKLGVEFNPYIQDRGEIQQRGDIQDREGFEDREDLQNRNILSEIAKPIATAINGIIAQVTQNPALIHKPNSKPQESEISDHEPIPDHQDFESSNNEQYKTNETSNENYFSDGPLDKTPSTSTISTHNELNLNEKGRRPFPNFDNEHSYKLRYGTQMGDKYYSSRSGPLHTTPSENIPFDNTPSISTISTHYELNPNLNEIENRPIPNFDDENSYKVRYGTQMGDEYDMGSRGLLHNTPSTSRPFDNTPSTSTISTHNELNPNLNEKGRTPIPDFDNEHSYIVRYGTQMGEYPNYGYKGIMNMPAIPSPGTSTITSSKDEQKKSNLLDFLTQPSVISLLTELATPIGLAIGNAIANQIKKPTELPVIPSQPLPSFPAELPVTAEVASDSELPRLPIGASTSRDGDENARLKNILLDLLTRPEFQDIILELLRPIATTIGESVVSWLHRETSDEPAQVQHYPEQETKGQMVLPGHLLQLSNQLASFNWQQLLDELHELQAQQPTTLLQANPTATTTSASIEDDPHLFENLEQKGLKNNPYIEYINQRFGEYFESLQSRLDTILDQVKTLNEPDVDFRVGDGGEHTTTTEPTTETTSEKEKTGDVASILQELKVEIHGFAEDLMKTVDTLMEKTEGRPTEEQRATDSPSVDDSVKPDSKVEQIVEKLKEKIAETDSKVDQIVDTLKEKIAETDSKVQQIEETLKEKMDNLSLKLDRIKGNIS